MISNVNREENVRIGRLGLVYSPIRNLDLSLSYEAGDRRANRLFNSFEYTTWFGSVRVGF